MMPYNPTIILQRDVRRLKAEVRKLEVEENLEIRPSGEQIGELRMRDYQSLVVVHKNR